MTGKQIREELAGIQFSIGSLRKRIEMERDLSIFSKEHIDMLKKAEEMTYDILCQSH